MSSLDVLPVQVDVTDVAMSREDLCGRTLFKPEGRFAVPESKKPFRRPDAKPRKREPGSRSRIVLILHGLLAFIRISMSAYLHDY